MGGVRPVIKALVIDDELPARSELAFLLDDIDGINVIGEAGNVRDAVALIKSKPADVIFLDINMPGVTGIQLAEGLKTHPRPPAIVFVTAHSHFAVKAFELNAIDYLVKPVETSRLRTAIEKVRAHLRDSGKHAQGQSSDAPDASEGDPASRHGDNTRVMVSKARKKIFIPVKDICFIMARDDYSYLYTSTERYLSTRSLTKLEEQLKGTRIFRVHRRYLVNLNNITSANAQSGDVLLLTVEGHEEAIPVSRRKVPTIKAELNI